MNIEAVLGGLCLWLQNKQHVLESVSLDEDEDDIPEADQKLLQDF